MVSVDLGPALEPEGLGTGAAVADLNGDGRLELLIAHGEAAQTLSAFHWAVNDNHFASLAARELERPREALLSPSGGVSVSSVE